MSTRGWWAALLLLVGHLLGDSAQAALKTAPVEFLSAEVALGSGGQSPESGWHRRSLPATVVTGATPEKPATIWMRFNFDRPQPGPLAIGFDHIGERFLATFNGVDIFRNHAEDRTIVYGWNRPWMAQIPAQLIRDHGNQLTVRLDTAIAGKLGIGDMRIGRSRDIQSRYDLRTLAQVQLPQIINWLLVVQESIVFFTWVSRRQEPEILWCAATCALWWFVNLHNYASAPPFDPVLFGELTAYAGFALLITLFATAAHYVCLPNRRVLIGQFALAGIGLIFLRAILVSLGMSDMICYGLAIPLAFATLVIVAKSAWQKPHHCTISMAIAMSLSIAAALHDFGLTHNIWNGATFSLLPFGSGIIVAIWMHTRWVRMVETMNEADDLNRTLEQRVADASTKLEKSEAARHELQVANAVEKERERLMLEIHDGIGSNLVTALAVAEKQNHPPSSINTLRRSLTDLRMAVDSLEPVEGEIPLLLASLRYRMEPELSKAGLALDWQVEDCPPMPWLDATGALHILRILQEAVSNIITHAQATLITVNCHAESFKNRGGVAIMIADNGIGLPQGANMIGKGIGNMASRSKSMQGEFSCRNNEDGGTVVRLWLPHALERLGVI